MPETSDRRRNGWRYISGITGGVSVSIIRRVSSVLAPVPHRCPARSSGGPAHDNDVIDAHWPTMAPVTTIR